MKNIRLILAWVILAFLSVCAAIYYSQFLLSPPPPVEAAEGEATPENFMRLHKGMHFQEVIAVLGPTDLMRANEVAGGVVEILAQSNLQGSWQTDHCKINIHFCESGDTGDDLAWEGTLTTNNGWTVDLKVRHSVGEKMRAWLPW